jgi:menaquinone-dependent protoporphyrinogen oxidase
MPRVRVLVLYGTGYGQTRKIALALADGMRPAGLDADVVDAREPVDPDPRAYTAVIVAAPVHAGGYPRAVRRWVQRHASALSGLPSAFVSVCLGVLEKNPKTDAVLAGIMTAFFEKTGWRPPVTKIVAGALPYTRYNWITRWIMRRIVARAHGDTDTTRDYEYTDWPDLEAFARDFSSRLVPTTMAAAG